MLTRLIPSKTRIKVLKLLLLNPDNSYYQREISQFTGLPIRAVQRELESLSDIGLVELTIRGNRKYYSANRKFAIFEELKSILLKTVALGDRLKEMLIRSKNKIQLAFIYGSYAQRSENTASDIDLFVIGEVSLRSLSAILSPAKAELGREINFSVYSVDEFRQGIKAKKHFLLRLLKEKKIFLIRDENVLKKIIG